MKTPARLLVRGVNWLGDAVMSMPALARLREALPNTHIALLTDEKLAALWQGHPALNEVIHFTKRDGAGGVSRKLREGAFDTALILPNSFRSAFESWLAGIRERVGYGGSGRNVLLTRVVPPRLEHVGMRKKSANEIRELIKQTPDKPCETFPSSAHHLHQYLRLAAQFGGSELPLPPSLPLPKLEVEQFCSMHKLPVDRRCIGLNPGAEYGPAKRWPIERFIEAGAKLQRQISPIFLLFGGPSDMQTVAVLEAGLREQGAACVNLAGKTTLRELAAGLASCEVVLTNDTGPMHLAAAVGTRVVVPFGSTSPELTGPGAPRDPRNELLRGQAPCAPCFLRVCPIDFRCMHSISADQAVRAMLVSG